LLLAESDPEILFQGEQDRKHEEDTIASYIVALKKIFVIEDMPAWSLNLRSKTAIRTSDTRYFVDSSMATAALGLGPEDLIEDLDTFGLLFETMAVRDLRVYADALDGQIYHYRDKNGLECDTVLHLRNGNFEMKSPSFLMLLTGLGQYAYRRPDGVYVVPIGCLKD
jgi:predicted AAA+ superfamily ATPase